MRRRSTLLAGFAVLLALLAACSKATSPAATGTEPNAPARPPSPAITTPATASAAITVVEAKPLSGLAHVRIGAPVAPSDYTIVLTRDHLASAAWHVRQIRGYPADGGELEIRLDSGGASKLASIRRQDRRRLLAVLVGDKLLAQTFLAKAVGGAKLTLWSTDPTATADLLDSASLKP